MNNIEYICYMITFIKEVAIKGKQNYFDYKWQTYTPIKLEIKIGSPQGQVISTTI